MFHVPTHKSASAGQVSPGLAQPHAKCDAQAARIARPDFIVLDRGTIVSLIPLTESAKQWIDDHLPDIESWQWLGRTLNIDHRMAGPILEGIVNDGLEVV